MQDLISQLTRLYLLDNQLCFEGEERLHPVALSAGRLEQHLLGVKTVALALLSPGHAPGQSAGRCIVFDFSAGGAACGDQQWRALCALANGVREVLGLTAPAVSISGRGFQLWLSLREPVAAARIAEFAALLHAAFLPDDGANGVLATAVALPPSRHAVGKWSAFIHPGMGTSFADEPYLEMAPPVGAQLGFLEGLRSISPAEFEAALGALRQRQLEQAQSTMSAPQPVAANPTHASPPANADTLLLKDASLEDIVRHLHARQIEPTFRYLLPPG